MHVEFYYVNYFLNLGEKSIFNNSFKAVFSDLITIWKVLYEHRILCSAPQAYLNS